MSLKRKCISLNLIVYSNISWILWICIHIFVEIFVCCFFLVSYAIWHTLVLNVSAIVCLLCLVVSRSFWCILLMKTRHLLQRPGSVVELAERPKSQNTRISAPTIMYIHNIRSRNPWPKKSQHHSVFKILSLKINRWQLGCPTY